MGHSAESDAGDEPDYGIVTENDLAMVSFAEVKRRQASAWDDCARLAWGDDGDLWPFANPYRVTPPGGTEPHGAQ